MKSIMVICLIVYLLIATIIFCVLEKRKEKVLKWYKGQKKLEVVEHEETEENAKQHIEIMENQIHTVIIIISIFILPGLKLSICLNDMLRKVETKLQLKEIKE